MLELDDSGDKGSITMGNQSKIEIKKWCRYKDGSLKLEIWEDPFSKDKEKGDTERIFDREDSTYYLREGVKVRLQKSSDHEVDLRGEVTENIECSAFNLVRINIANAENLNLGPRH